jgi:protein-serine/threonine kinase
MVYAVHKAMTTSTSRSNSPTFGGTRSRSTSASQFGQKLKGLFRFTHTGISSAKSSQHSPSTEHLPRLPTPPSEKNGNSSSNASTSPYFHHQGLAPHHQMNGTSTGRSSADGIYSFGGGNSSETDDAILSGAVVEQPKQTASPPLSPTSALKQQLRRVASAPNAHGLLGGLTKNGTSSNNTSSQSVDSRKTSPLAAAPLRPPTADGIPSNGYLLPVPPNKDHEPPGRPQKPGAFRRTYSSNSIKIRNVEVGPGSFEKIKLLGKGDVGKVYLVKEKKSSRLYAMKGLSQLLIY